MKIRLKGAQKGHSLLKKKADALTLRFRQILSKIIEVGTILHCVLRNLYATKLKYGPLQLVLFHGPTETNHQIYRFRNFICHAQHSCGMRTKWCNEYLAEYLRAETALVMNEPLLCEHVIS